MPFYKRPGSPNAAIGRKADGWVPVPPRQWQPGYVDPLPVQRLRDFYLARWEAQGKPPTQYRRALAIALARHTYYANTMPRNQVSSRLRHQRQALRLRGAALVPLMNKAREARRKVRQEQQERLAQGKGIQRQFINPVE